MNSLPRATYKERVDAGLPQVLTSWCLVRYCTITGTLSNKEHWKGEFLGHMYAISWPSIKGNDSFDARRKVLSEILYENDYDHPQFLTLTVCNKFITEGLDIKSDAFLSTVSDCIQNIRRIFELILKRDVQEINDYAKTI